MFDMFISIIYLSFYIITLQFLEDIKRKTI